MQKSTGTTITITEKDGKGFVDVFGNNKESIETALYRIKIIVFGPEVGATFLGTVRSIQAYGAFIEIVPGKDGLLHISEYDWARIDSLEGILKEGDKIEVKLLEVDEKTGKLRLSRRALLPKPEGYVEPERPPRPPRDDSRRNDRRSNDRRSNDRKPPRRD